jgi:hypothetical protein
MAHSPPEKRANYVCAVRLEFPFETCQAFRVLGEKLAVTLTNIYIGRIF